jgi:hypothetical protein
MITVVGEHLVVLDRHLAGVAIDRYSGVLVLW